MFGTTPHFCRLFDEIRALLRPQLRCHQPLSLAQRRDRQRDSTMSRRPKMSTSGASEHSTISPGAPVDSAIRSPPWPYRNRHLLYNLGLAAGFSACCSEAQKLRVSLSPLAKLGDHWCRFGRIGS
jgi:hypothetical protein